MSILEKKGIPFSFSNDSEIIVKTLINKIISLSITKSFTSKVDNELPNYCYEKLKQIIKSYCELQYMSYDRDDGPPPKIKNLNPSKSVINDFEISKVSEFKNSLIDESIKINKTQLEKKINDSFLNFSKDKINEKENEKEKEKEKIPFENYIEKIEKIDISSLNESNIENNILLNDNDNNLFYDNYFEEKNFWGTLKQPNSIITDRDASTMIKYSKDIIIDSDRLSNSIKETKSSRIQNNIFRKKIKKKKKENENENEEKNKKKIILPIEAHDIPIEQFPTLIEGEEIYKLREEKEEEIKLKKIEEIKRIQKEEERIQKEKEKNEKLKETPLRDITIDPNGNIIHIRPLNIDQLINEFNYANSNQKHIDKILGEQPKIKRNSLLIEKNPNKSGLIIDMSGKNLKENQKKKNDINSFFSKKRKSINNSLIETNSNKDHNNNNNNENKNHNNLIGNNSLPIINQITSIIKKSTSQFAAGSNFDLMELETGVDLRENSKFKSGGKDYFKKYNKYSIENFEKQQNKTQTENFYKTRNEDFRETIYSHTDEHRKTMDNINKNIKRENKNNFLNLEPSEMNNTLHLKTHNLNKALSELDLISENTINENKMFIKNKPGDLFNKKKLVNMKNYDAMNKFAKTLMGSSSWGISNRKKNLTHETEFIIPKKVLYNNNNDNLFNYHTRSKKKITPLNKNKSNVNIINNKMSITSTNGFYKGNMKKPFKLPKLKEQDFIDMIEKDEENDKKNFVTTHNFYK